MPLRYRKKRRVKRGRKRGVKKKTTASMYRSAIPRTLQIATRRNKSQVLRFVVNQTYQVNPGGLVGGLENVYLKFRANSIYDVMCGTTGNGAGNANGTWLPQDQTPASGYGPLQPIPINAEGYDEWSPKYFHSTVLGSKIQATYEPYGISPMGTGGGIACPSTMYIAKSGVDNIITTSTEMSAINKLPYTKRARVIPTFTRSNPALTQSTTTSAGGVRLHMNYSAKRFEGVRDVRDNRQLSSQMGAAPLIPTEQSFFWLGLRNTIPSPPSPAQHIQPSGIMTIKIEYIVLLTEPTETNSVQASTFGSFLNIANL